MTAMRTVKPLWIACLLGLVAAGCGSKGKSADKTAYKVFPKESEFIVGIDGDKLRKAGAERVTSQLPAKVAAIVKSLKSCGIDVIDRVDSAVIAGSVAEQRGVAAIKGFTREDFKQCGEIATELKVDQKDKVTSMTVEGQPVAGAWIDDKTIIGGAYWKPEELTKLAAGEGGADQNKALMSLLGDVDTSAAIWGVFVPKDPNALPTGGMLGEVKGAFASVKTGDGFKLDAGLKLGSSDEASKIAKQLEQVIPMFKGEAGELGKYLDKVKFKSSGSKLIVQISLSESELAEIGKALKNDERLQMLMGGM